MARPGKSTGPVAEYGSCGGWLLVTMSLKETRVALVTGASRGIGAAVAEELASMGYAVVAIGRTAGALEEVDDRVRKRGGHPLAIAVCDLARDETVENVFAAFTDRWNHLDLLVHCAIDAPPMAPLVDYGDLRWVTAYRVNVLSTVRLIRASTPLLRSAPSGAAVFFGDERMCRQYAGVYGSSKAAQIALARIWASESRNLGPRIVLFKPRPTATGLRRRFFPGEGTEGLATPTEEAERVIALLGQEHLLR